MDEKLEEKKMPDKKKESIYKASTLNLPKLLREKKTKQNNDGLLRCLQISPLSLHRV